jgi:phage host-nuclease inhibitor protein Gam
LTVSTTSEIKQLHNEVKIMRREIQEIKEMLIPEVVPTKDEIKAIEKGRKDYARANLWNGKHCARQRRDPTPSCTV